MVSLLSQAQEVTDMLIPVLHIQTVRNEMPPYTVISAPEGCIGTTIKDNKYVAGRMVMTLKADTLYDSGEYEKSVSGMRIKVRGNSTGAFLAQRPYKIKLSKKYDLLGRTDQDFKHKEWVLLAMYTWNKKMTNHESNILNIVGLTISRLLEKEWTPEFDFVHVILNEEYQGMYYLMESVDKGEKRVNISPDGFLLEHDVFWWNEKVYFKTDQQSHDSGYTYKYPDPDNVNDSIQSVISDYMNQIEHNILFSEDIDLLSFAKWLLIHDILGTDDAAGCNRYLCKYDMCASLLQMGPLWDFDSTFRSDGWSSLHHYESFFYPRLLQRTDFRDIYCKLWKQVRPNLFERIQNELKQVWNQYGEVFDESMKLHQTKYSSEGRQSFISQIVEVKEKLYRRIEIVDSLMLTDFNVNCINHPIYNNRSNTYLIDMQGRKHQQTPHQRLPKGIYIYHGENKKIVIQ